MSTEYALYGALFGKLCVPSEQTTSEWLGLDEKEKRLVEEDQLLLTNDLARTKKLLKRVQSELDLSRENHAHLRDILNSLVDKHGNYISGKMPLRNLQLQIYLIMQRMELGLGDQESLNDVSEIRVQQKRLLNCRLIAQAEIFQIQDTLKSAAYWALDRFHQKLIGFENSSDMVLFVEKTKYAVNQIREDVVNWYLTQSLYFESANKKASELMDSCQFDGTIPYLFMARSDHPALDWNVHQWYPNKDYKYDLKTIVDENIYGVQSLLLI